MKNSGDLEDLARSIGEVLTLAGLHSADSMDGLSGGYSAEVLDGLGVHVAWLVHDDANTPLNWSTRALDSLHPPVEFHNRARDALLRAIVDLLYGAGFTITLTSADVDSDQNTALLVTEGPTPREDTSLIDPD